MSEAFNPFAAALEVRDALEHCSCCADEDEGQEHFEAATELLVWVSQAQAELAALRGMVRVDGASAPRAPLSAAERARRYRQSRPRVTKTVTERHENRHGERDESVTQNVTENLPHTPSSLSPKSSESNGNHKKEERESVRTSVTSRHGERHEERDAKRDAKRDGERDAKTPQGQLWDAWCRVAANGNPMGSPSAHWVLLGSTWKACVARDADDPVGVFERAAAAYLAARKAKNKPPTFKYLLDEFGEWDAAAKQAASPSPRALNGGSAPVSETFSEEENPAWAK